MSRSRISVKTPTLAIAPVDSAPAVPVLAMPEESTLGLLLEQSPFESYVRGLSPGSQRTATQSLNAIALALTDGKQDAADLDWSRLRYQHTQAVRAYLIRKHKPATVTKMLSFLRGVLREAYRVGLMDSESYRKAVDLEPVRGQTLLRGRMLEFEEIEALFKSVESDRPIDIRDSALLALLMCGLRREEVVNLQLSHVSLKTGAISVIEGKGNKSRSLFLPVGADRAIARWLQIRGKEAGPLLCGVRKNGAIVLKTLSPQTVYDVVEKLAIMASLSEVVSPHDFRRTFTSLMLERTDAATVQRMMGHANIQTTVRYDRRGEASMKAAAALLEIPYHS